jgi:hypothetical protein
MRIIQLITVLSGRVGTFFRLLPDHVSQFAASDWIRVCGDIFKASNGAGNGCSILIGYQSVPRYIYSQEIGIRFENGYLFDALLETVIRSACIAGTYLDYIDRPIGVGVWCAEGDHSYRSTFHIDFIYGTEDRSEAIVRARNAEQECIYDTVTGEDVPVPYPREEARNKALEEMGRESRLSGYLERERWRHR